MCWGLYEASRAGHSTQLQHYAGGLREILFGVQAHRAHLDSEQAASGSRLACGGELLLCTSLCMLAEGQLSVFECSTACHLEAWGLPVLSEDHAVEQLSQHIASLLL